MAVTNPPMAVARDPKQHKARMIGRAFFIFTAKYRKIQKQMHVMTIETPLLAI